MKAAFQVAEHHRHCLDALLVGQILQSLFANLVCRDPGLPLFFGLQIQLFQLCVGKGKKIPLFVGHSSPLTMCVWAAATWALIVFFKALAGGSFHGVACTGPQTTLAGQPVLQANIFAISINAVAALPKCFCRAGLGQLQQLRCSQLRMILHNWLLLRAALRIEITGMHKSRARQRAVTAFALVLLLLLPAQPVRAYSVLSHEQVVDLAWKSRIVPLLRYRWPDITPEQIKEAHAYAYGGAIIQDIGYYPFGDKLLSDMLHYVRSGEFVDNLIREAQNPDEFAFALGALAHYTSDAYGHPAVNRATASEYPNLKRRYGPEVLYDQDPKAHLQTEFGFDVLEVVQQRFAPEAFHGFIGFQVSKPVFERAFQDTYGIPLNLILTKEDLAIGTYRKTVSTLLPKMTQVAVANYGKQMQQAEPTFVPEKLIYRMSNADYQKSFGDSYRRPGLGTRILAFLIKLVPKVGPVRDLELRVPNADAQRQFLSGMDTVVDHYEQAIEHLRSEPAVHPSLNLAAVNLDTGRRTAPGNYPLADQTYANYLAVLAELRPTSNPASQPAKAYQQPQATEAAAQPKLQSIDPAIRADIEHYFQNSRRHGGVLQLKKSQWKSLEKNLLTLQRLPAAPPTPATEQVASSPTM